METASPKGGLRSKEFDDLYFSAQDGLAETHYVFLKGNTLPENWQGKPAFTICETGFGTGLNFLATWKLFRETKENGQSLHFISFEKFPLEESDIMGALEPLLPEDYKYYLKQAVSYYNNPKTGMHKYIFGADVTLTLICEDVNNAIPKLETTVDAWFLDGFKPSTNPDMWSDTLFQNMARLSHKGTTVSSFTAAGTVRRGLAAAGFTIQKTKGFGHKRHMITGVL